MVKIQLKCGHGRYLSLKERLVGMFRSGFSRPITDHDHRKLYLSIILPISQQPIIEALLVQANGLFCVYVSNTDFISHL